MAASAAAAPSSSATAAAAAAVATTPTPLLPLPYVVTSGRDAPHLCNTAPNKTLMRKCLTEMARCHFGLDAVQPEAIDRASMMFERPCAVSDGQERLHVRTKGAGMVPSRLTGVLSVPVAALTGSMMAIFQRPMGGSSSANSGGARPVVGALSFDIVQHVPAAKGPTHAYRKASEMRQRKAPQSRASAAMMTRMLREEGLVHPQIAKALNEDGCARAEILGEIVSLLHARVTQRPGNLRENFVLVISGHGGGVHPLARPDVPLVCVAGARPPSSTLVNAWMLEPLDAEATLWNAYGLAHLLGEADCQHFYFAERFQDPEIGFCPDVVWMDTKDGDAPYNAVLHMLLQHFFCGAIKLPYRVRVPGQGARPAYSENPTATAEAILAECPSYSAAFSRMLALAAAGNDYVPTFTNAKTPKKNPAVAAGGKPPRFLRVPPKEFVAQYQKFFAKEGDAAILVQLVPPDLETPMPFPSPADSQALLSRQVHPDDKSTFTEVLVPTTSAKWKPFMMRFLLDNMATYLGSFLGVDYLPQRVDITISYFANALQIGRPLLLELCVPNTRDVRLGFCRHNQHQHQDNRNELLWNFCC